MKERNQDRELWMALEILAFLGLTTIISTNVYLKIATDWGPIIGGFIIWIGTPLALTLYSLFLYIRPLRTCENSRGLKSMAFAVLMVFINYVAPIIIYGPYSYGQGP